MAVHELQRLHLNGVVPLRPDLGVCILVYNLYPLTDNAEVGDAWSSMLLCYRFNCFSTFPSSLSPCRAEVRPVDPTASTDTPRDLIADLLLRYSLIIIECCLIHGIHLSSGTFSKHKIYVFLYQYEYMSDEQASALWRDITVFAATFLGVYLLSGFVARFSIVLNLLAIPVAALVAGIAVFAVRRGDVPS